MLENKRIAMINLGCKANKYEADAMTKKLIDANAKMVDAGEIADVYIVNTCSVTNIAEKKSRQMLRRAKKKNPKAVVAAVGCYVNASKDEIADMDFVDLVIGNNCKKDIVEILQQYFTKSNPVQSYIDINCTNEYEEMGSLHFSSLNHQRAYIKIQDGCNQFCSYCLIPYTRGRVRSRKPEHILNEITQLAKEGVKEFVLTGIHISSYGLDFVKTGIEYDERMNQDTTDLTMDLASLVEAIEAIPEVKRIRLGSLEPRIITEEFLERIGKCDKLCPHFHLSLQSACNDTLKRMNRKYTIELFEEKCILLRNFFDCPAITTDVIVGFPGETEEEFATTVENLKRISLYEIHVFKYSIRSGTLAAKMPEQISENIKNERSDILLELTSKQKKAYEDSYNGKMESVLVEEKISKENAKKLKQADLRVQESEDTEGEISYYTGHTRNYIKVAIASKKNICNEIVDVVF